MQEILKSNKIVLEKLKASHFDGLSNIFQDRELIGQAGLDIPEGREEQQLLFRLWLNHPYQFVILQNKEVVGMIGLYPWYEKLGLISDQQVEIGYLLKRELWGQHIMHDAIKLLTADFFADTEFNEIKAIVQASNERSLKLLQHAGFVVENDDGSELTLLLKR